MRHSIARLQRLNADKDADIETLKGKILHMGEQIEKSRSAAEKTTQQLEHQRLIISGKDKRILRAERTQRHLDNFRFVLFHRVKQLEEEKAPLREQVDSLRSAVKDMYGEFVSEFEMKKSLQHDFHETGKKLARSHTQNQALREKNAAVANEVGSLLKEVQHVMSEASKDRDDRQLLVRLRDLIHHEGKKMNIKHIRSQTTPHDTDGHQDQIGELHEDDLEPNIDLTKELLHQRNLLLTKAKTVTELNAKLTEENYLGRRRMMTENSAMIQELNELRIEKKELNKRVEDLEAKLASMTSSVGVESYGPKALSKSRSTVTGLTPYQQQKMKEANLKAYRRSLALQEQSRGSCGAARFTEEGFSEHAELLEEEGYRLSRLQFEYVTDSHPTTQGSSSGLNVTRGSEEGFFNFHSTEDILVTLPENRSSSSPIYVPQTLRFKYDWDPSFKLVAHEFAWSFGSIGPERTSLGSAMYIHSDAQYGEQGR
ncbi:hypothetical protein FOL47_008224 [Perkinsus chesapeaki]|uniref:Uncharacterized protein n=1 Tax=Perkinsus chesapeaki TaxID=330153 RepID=A0A7J6LFK5_PERCH|nr:hypothetical protein FOL47_008224 [Perkinsus chesapeaki]